MKSYLLLATITWRTLIMNEYRILKKVLSAKNKCLMSMVQMILHILPYRKHIWPRRTVFQAAKVVIISFLILYHVMFMLQSRGLDSLCMTIALTYCLISSWIKTRQVIRENPHRIRLQIAFELLFFCCTRHYHSISHKA